MTQPFNMRFVTLEGTPRERGRIHGETLRSEILELMERFRDDTRQECLHPLIERTGLLAAAEKWTPDLVEEVRGIGEGAGLDFKTIFAWQLVEEVGWLGEYEKTLGSDDLGSGGCSALGVFGEESRSTLLAQTADNGVSVDGYQTFLHVKCLGSSLEAFVLTYPGWVGVYGLNSRGIGVCLNTISRQMNYAPDGLPVLFVGRGILAQPTLSDAIKFVRGIKHASGENYVIGEPGRVIDYECSANRVCQFIPYEGATRVYHTNHALVNDDVRLTARAMEKLPADVQLQLGRARQNSETRFRSLENWLRDTSEPVTVERVKSILSSHDSPEYPICRHKRPDNPGMTNACLIMECSTLPVMHVASGPPCMTEFKSFRF